MSVPSVWLARFGACLAVLMAPEVQPTQTASSRFWHPLGAGLGGGDIWWRLCGPPVAGLLLSHSVASLSSYLPHCLRGSQGLSSASASVSSSLSLLPGSRPLPVTCSLFIPSMPSPIFAFTVWAENSLESPCPAQNHCVLLPSEPCVWFRALHGGRQ